jgi:hypothetical protein
VGADFWLGLALSIPVGVGVNLLTPRLSSFYGRRSKRFEAARLKKERARVKLGQELRNNQFAYLAFTHQTNSRLITYAILIVMAVNIPFYYSGLTSLSGDFTEPLAYGWSYLITIVLTAYLAVAFLNTRRRGQDIVRLVATLGGSTSSDSSSGDISAPEAQETGAELPGHIGGT